MTRSPAFNASLPPERLLLLVGELRHRFCNLLAIVDALAERTARESVALSDFLPVYRGRIAALERTHALLFRTSQDESLNVHQLLQLELAALGALSGDEDNRVELQGPRDIGLPPDSLQVLALAIHELATNSMKYGALAERGGSLRLTWGRIELERRPYIHITWHEVFCLPRDGLRDGGTGFGRELIERALPLQLGAQTRYTLTDEGVYCSIDLPDAFDGRAFDGRAFEGGALDRGAFDRANS